jgi:apolipoprotein N-acyltransferase
MDRYDKCLTVPWFESDLAPGREIRPMQSPFGAIGALICYESTFPWLTRQLVVNGASILVVSTNDVHLSASAISLQHADLSIFRAIESRRCVIRASNLGPAMIIDPLGRAIEADFPFMSAQVFGKIEAHSDLSPYHRWGDILVGVCVLMVLAIVVVLLLEKLQNRKLLPASIGSQ